MSTQYNHLRVSSFLVTQSGSDKQLSTTLDAYPALKVLLHCPSTNTDDIYVGGNPSPNIRVAKGTTLDLDFSAGRGVRMDLSKLWSNGTLNDVLNVTVFY